MEIKEAVEFIKYFYILDRRPTREEVDKVEQAQSALINAILTGKIEIIEK